jgi:hypothetical protein
MTLEFARALHFRELDAKAQNDTRVGVFAALLSATGGAIAFVISRAWPADSLWSFIGLGLALLAAAALLLAAVGVLRSLIGFDWAYLPSADTLLAHWRALSFHFKANPSFGSAREDFDDELLERLSSAATQNGANNRLRSARLYIAAQLLLVVVLLLAGAASALAVNAYSRHVSQRGDSTVADAPKPSHPAAKPAAPSANPSPSSPSAKPTMPQNVIQKGGAERPKPEARRGR